jgi:hypothetical protein
MLGGFAKPADRFLAVFGDGVAKAVHHAEIKLRIDMALFGEWPKVPQRRRVVIFHICGPASVEVRFKALR